MELRAKRCDRSVNHSLVVLGIDRAEIEDQTILLDARDQRDNVMSKAARALARALRRMLDRD